MTVWRVEYNPYIKFDPSNPEARELEIPCFRIFPENEPERWIAQTNEDLPAEVQEEAARIIAEALNEALNKVLGP